jgi:hypothetical protein
MNTTTFHNAVLAMTAQDFVKPVTCTYMEASTAHITEDDNALLSAYDDKDANGDLCFDHLRHGWLVYVPDSDTTEGLPHSDAFKTLLHYARESGFNVLNLDCDATTYPQLQTFDW